jgi:arylsulfatase A-like enzyme
VNGTQIFPGQYLTSWINDKAIETIDRFAPRRKPFYLQIDQFAPHIGDGQEGGRCDDAPVPSPLDAQLFADAVTPVNPATEEADVSDKPEFISRKPPRSLDDRQRADRFYGCALATLRALDRGVSGVLGALRRNRELNSTMVVFTSDNGLSFGEHRVQFAKGLPYDEE